MKKFCFLNGNIVPLEEAKIGVEDIGLLRGYGIYDGLAVFNGKAFHFGDHWDRLLSGAHILNLNVPVTEEKAKKITEELAQKNGFTKRANVRIILTGGQAINGIEYDFEKPTFIILVEEWTPLPNDLYENGGKLITYKHMRELPEYKTTNYIRATNLQDWRKEEKAVEILYTHDGEILECSTSNIFIVKGGKIITPSDNILKGITRKVVLEIGKEKYEIEERPVEEKELETSDEIFITSSFKDIVPIVKVDDFEIGGGKVGEVTKNLIAKFKALTSVA